MILVRDGGSKYPQDEKLQSIDDCFTPTFQIKFCYLYIASVLFELIQVLQTPNSDKKVFHWVLFQLNWFGY